MSEMVERVEEAIRRRMARDGGYELSDLARAAIEAMREPTTDMENAGAEADDYGLDAVQSWSVMIDAALKEKPE